MIKSISVLCVAFALFGLLQTGKAINLRRDYYILPSSQDIQQTRELRDIKAALVKIAQGSEPARDPLKTLIRIGRLLDETEDYFEKDVFGELLSLTDNTDSCSASFMKYIIDIIGILEDCRDKSLDKLHHYLDRYGKHKFRLCADKLEFEFMKKTSRDYNADFALDQFFNIALGIEENLSDRKLYEILTIVDLATMTSFQNRRQLFKFVENRSTTPRFAMSKTKFVVNFFLHECSKVLVPLEKSINVFNLARDLDGYEIEDADLLKLNEYRRICNGLMDPLRREVTSNNIEKLIETDQP